MQPAIPVFHLAAQLFLHKAVRQDQKRSCASASTTMVATAPASISPWDSTARRASDSACSNGVSTTPGHTQLTRMPRSP